MNQFPIGTKVRVIDPESFVSEKAKKFRNRVGVVKGHQTFSDNPIVVFGAVGRRKEYVCPFQNRYLELAE